MSGIGVAHHLIVRRGSLSAGVSGGGGDHSLHMLEHGLNAPETTAGKNRSFVSCGFGQRRVNSGRGKRRNAAGLRLPARDYRNQNGCKSQSGNSLEMFRSHVLLLQSNAYFFTNFMATEFMQ